VPTVPDFYRLVLNHLNEGVYFVDKNRTITFWNQGAERISGYSESEVVHKPCYWNVLMHADSTGNNLCEDRCPLLLTMEDGKIRDETLLLRQKDGSRVPVAVHVIPMQAPSGDIVGAVEIFSDITPKSENTKKIKALATMAYFDLVTGLTNRRYAESRINLMTTEYKKTLFPFGLLIISVIGFKTLNDKYGQEFGDQVLRSIARNMVAGVGPSDIVSRWDGTHFLVITPNTKKTLLILMAEKIKGIVFRAAKNEDSDESSVRIVIGGTISRMNDTPTSLKQRIVAQIKNSEHQIEPVVFDED
jgi:diguanylate cyclase (GGDEF)-like protein/PAS domain S-box-containing protein